MKLALPSTTLQTQLTPQALLITLATAAILLPTLSQAFIQCESEVKGGVVECQDDPTYYNKFVQGGDATLCQRNNIPKPVFQRMWGLKVDPPELSGCSPGFNYLLMWCLQKEIFKQPTINNTEDWGCIQGTEEILRTGITYDNWDYCCKKAAVLTANITGNNTSSAPNPSGSRVPEDNSTIYWYCWCNTGPYCNERMMEQLYHLTGQNTYSTIVRNNVSLDFEARAMEPKIVHEHSVEKENKEEDHTVLVLLIAGLIVIIVLLLCIGCCIWAYVYSRRGMNNGQVAPDQNRNEEGAEREQQGQEQHGMAEQQRVPPSKGSSRARVDDVESRDTELTRSSIFGNGREEEETGDELAEGEKGNGKKVKGKKSYDYVPEV